MQETRTITIEELIENFVNVDPDDARGSETIEGEYRLKVMSIIREFINDDFRKLNMHGRLVAMQHIRVLAQCPTYTEQK